jgi:hypothetical protein
MACSSRALATTTRVTWGSMIRAMASALPVASRATSSSAARLAASSSSSSGREGTRPAERRRPPSLTVSSQKSRWTSMPIARMGALLPCMAMAERRRANRHRRIRARSTPGCSRRGGHRQDRARSPRQLRPARPAFSLRSPWPGARSLQLPPRRRVSEASQVHFHDRTRRPTTGRHSQSQANMGTSRNRALCSTIAHGEPPHSIVTSPLKITLRRHACSP